MTLTRCAGILLHPTSLPGPYGIGDLGSQAHGFVDWLAQAGFRLWQVLPLGPTGYGNSPYQCHSVSAGNPNLISPELLVRDGYVDAQDLDWAGPVVSDADSSVARIDYAAVITWKDRLLERAFERFLAGGNKAARIAFEEFRARNSSWIEEYSTYMALKRRYAGASWVQWPERLGQGPAAGLKPADSELRHAAMRIAFEQMLFFDQWSELHSHARARGILVVGDIPIFAAEDSADVWSHPELFYLDSVRRPVAVAGVPPDYFAPTGQLWGNPLYRWDVHETTSYEWWLARLRAVLARVDFVRLDHFRGLAAYWAVPADAPTAEHGSWLPGPGSRFLEVVLGEIDSDPGRGEATIIAEDLGVITPDVRRLLAENGLPGMRVLQFGLAGHYEDYLPENFVQECIAYTGTHDNDTARGWYQHLSAADRRIVKKRLDSSDASVVKDMVRAVCSSSAAWAILPIQDILELGTEARMNFPGKPTGNWEWRLRPHQLHTKVAEAMHDLIREFGRLPTT